MIDVVSLMEFYSNMSFFACRTPFCAYHKSFNVDFNMIKYISTYTRATPMFVYTYRSKVPVHPFQNRFLLKQRNQKIFLFQFFFNSLARHFFSELKLIPQINMNNFDNLLENS